MRLSAVAAIAVSVVFPSTVLAESALVVKDANGATQSISQNISANGYLFPSVGLYLGANLVSAGNPLPVSIVGGFNFQLAPTITVQNAAYSAGYSEGGTITVTGAARTNGGSGILNGVRVRSTGGATNTIWIYAWSKMPTSTCVDKSAFVVSAADSANALVGFPQSVTLVSPGSWDTASYGQSINQLANFVNKDTSPGTAIYLCLVTAGSVTPATTADLQLVVSGLQD